MFTGLIEHVGRVVRVDPAEAGCRLEIATPLAMEMAAGDSLAVNGVCLTVKPEGGSIHADVGPETQRVTTLGSLKTGSMVNLERSMVADGRFGDDNLGWLGYAQDGQLRTVGDLAQAIEARLNRTPLLIGDPAQPIGRIGWCTGAAHTMLGNAIAAGANVYLSGEVSEPTVHLARESGVAYLACGHHATERYGVQALGKHLAEHFGIEHCFIDIENPV